MASVFGISVVALAATLVPFFPASPLIVLADAMPRLGLAGLGIAALCFAAVETLPRGRTLLLLALAGVLAAWKVQSPPPGPSAWTAIPEPSGVTEHGRWRAVREVLPEGGDGDSRRGRVSGRGHGSARFLVPDRRSEGPDTLCRRHGNLEPGGQGRRLAAWPGDLRARRPARRRCSGLAWHSAAHGRLAADAGRGDRQGRAGLSCLPGGLPALAWARVWTSGTTGGVVVVSNDGAFGTVPVDVMRRRPRAPWRRWSARRRPCRNRTDGPGPGPGGRAKDEVWRPGDCWRPRNCCGPGDCCRRFRSGRHGT